MNARHRRRLGIATAAIIAVIGCGPPKPEISPEYQKLTPAERTQRNQERWAKRGLRANPATANPASAAPAGQ